MKAKIAVIYFPGNNCENESVRACIACGMDADLLRWNTSEDLNRYNGFIIPGGFSYEDRVRAGAIASKDSVMERIKDEAKKGKAVLGICNGAQILVESGMIPGLKDKVEMALAPNRNPFVSGYYCTWVYVKNTGKRKTAFNSELKKDEVMHMPIAHGEGRFTTNDRSLLNELIKNDQILFRYCDMHGNITDKFPVNPNGAIYNIAGLCNREGNVMAIMPHPERGAFNKNLPGFEGRSFEENEKLSPAAKILISMKKYVEARK